MFGHVCVYTYMCIDIYTQSYLTLNVKIKQIPTLFIWSILNFFSQESFLYLLTSVIYHSSPFYLLNKDKIYTTLLKMFLSIFPRIYFQIQWQILCHCVMI